MYSKIYNPLTGRKVNINSKLGKKILNKYISNDKKGGSQSKNRNLEKNKTKKYEKLYNIFSPHMAIDKARHASLEGAWELGLFLKKNRLDLVTAESLTAGMIGKTIIDIPYFGAAVLYGGFTVYNTDAKRLYLNVNTPSVYSEDTAEQMALGALQNSRAKVSLAVTGNAMPYPDHSDAAGVVDVGLAIRVRKNGNDGAIVRTIRLNLCRDEPLVAQICGQWKAEGIESNLGKEKTTCSSKLSKNLSSASTKLLRKEMNQYEKGAFWEGPYARFQTTSRMAEAIRLFTVGYATKWAKNELHYIFSDKDLSKAVRDAIIPQKPWDKLYLSCGEPSMSRNLGYQDFPAISWPDHRCCGINGEYDEKCPKLPNTLQKEWSNNIGRLKNLNHLFKNK